MTATTKDIQLPSVIESVEKAAAGAADFAKQAGLNEEAMFGVDMAVREAVANAVKHGNKLDGTKPVDVTFSNLSGVFEITVRDHGAGFAVEEVPDPTAEENLLKNCGRGILFMRSFMDEVEWTNHPQGGTIVRMSKKH